MLPDHKTRVKGKAARISELVKLAASIFGVTKHVQ